MNNWTVPRKTKNHSCKTSARNHSKALDIYIYIFTFDARYLIPLSKFVWIRCKLNQLKQILSTNRYTSCFWNPNYSAAIMTLRHFVMRHESLMLRHDVDIIITYHRCFVLCSVQYFSIIVIRHQLYVKLRCGVKGGGSFTY